MSKHVWFVASTILIIFVGTLIEQPAIINWLNAHPIYDALITAAGVAFQALNTYLPKPDQAPPSGTNAIAAKSN